MPCRPDAFDGSQLAQTLDQDLSLHMNFMMIHLPGSDPLSGDANMAHYAGQAACYLKSWAAPNQTCDIHAYACTQ